MNTKKLVNLSNQYPRLTVRTLATLMAIGENEGCSVSELSQFMGVNEKNVATTIRRLLEDGGQDESCYGVHDHPAQDDFPKRKAAEERRQDHDVAEV